MADNKHKSQAEKAASASKSKGATDKKKTEEKGGGKVMIKNHAIPVRFITSAVFITVFVVFLVTFINPDGWLVKWLSEFYMGLFGYVGYLVSIPGFLYLFIILF